MMKLRSFFSRKTFLAVVLVTASLSAFATPCLAKVHKHKGRHHAKVHVTKKQKKGTQPINALAKGALTENGKVHAYAKQFSTELIKNTQQKDDFKYIEAEIIQRKLPKELAWLPMIESNFNSEAISCKGAVGLWQFMPATGKMFGLKQTALVDERKDLKASTKAALTHLEYLHKKFNRDWNLALAAYNAGEGTVDRAIKKNKKAGKSTSFWSLKLPKETREYVPKFLGISKVAKSIS